MTDDTVSTALPEGQYAIVELMGHATLIGRVEEVDRFGIKMLQIEPIFAGQLLGPVLHAGGSIYRYTPCSPGRARRPFRKSTERRRPAMTLAPSPAGLPKSYNGCTCSCHRTPGIMHMAPCCRPSLHIDAEWLKRKLETDPDEGEIGAGFELFSTPVKPQSGSEH